MKSPNIVSWLANIAIPPETDRQIEVRAAELATAAPNDSVTTKRLAGKEAQTHHPLVEYLEADERPQYILSGSELLISNEDDSLARKHPSRGMYLLASDQRILFVLGGRITDNVWEVPLNHIVATYVDGESMRQHLVVDADRDGVEMTFFADITLETNQNAIDGCVGYIENDSS